MNKCKCEFPTWCYEAEASKPWRSSGLVLGWSTKGSVYGALWAYESVTEQFLTLKIAFLLAILKKVEDVQILSVSPSGLRFILGMVKAFLQPELCAKKYWLTKSTHCFVHRAALSHYIWSTVCLFWVNQEKFPSN